ncbi:MAG: hypothetical protein ACRD50_10515 [Candidatus Acidiferrales bacterium]
MADWRQIQARIRRAKTSPDPGAKLSELFAKTHDAMVAFELGAVAEKAGNAEEAVQWYTTASERFRRAEWKKKAAEALTRMGAPVPDSTSQTIPREMASTDSEEIPEKEFHTEKFAEQTIESVAAVAPPAEKEAQLTPTIGEISPAPGESQGENRGRKRRGRRGGRRHKKNRGATAAPGLPAKAFAASAASASSVVKAPAPPARAEIQMPVRAERPVEAPVLPSEREARGRASEPALASRMAQLESRLRRLIAGPLHRFDEADDAPAGPGVVLLSDSDLVETYYVEACDTLRVAIGNLARGGRAGRGGRGASRDEESLKARLAEHLGINETKTSQYLKDHCVVRWIQLDDDAKHLAHFAIAILRPILQRD